MSNPYPALEPHVEAVPISRGDVERMLQKMEHDLRTAARNRNEAPDWCLTIAHQAIYGGCVALMGANGCRPRVNGHHKTALRFAGLALPQHRALIDEAETVRRQRHRAMYGTMSQVSRSDVDETLSLARRLAPILKAAALGTLAASVSPEKQGSRQKSSGRSGRRR